LTFDRIGIKKMYMTKDKPAPDAFALRTVRVIRRAPTHVDPPQ
jgi:hypothetical protein